MKQKIYQQTELREMGLSFLRSPEIINSNFEEIMKEKGIGYKDLAKLTGTTRQSIHYTINKNGATSIDNALKWAYVLGVSVDDLFDLADDAWYETAKDDDGKTIYYDHSEDCLKSGTEMKNVDKKVRIKKDKSEQLTEREYEERLNKRIKEVVSRETKELGDKKYMRDDIATIKATVVEECEEAYPKRYEMMHRKIHPIVLED